MSYIASLSYGKDSLAMLEAIKLLGLPLDRIVHAEVWATDDIPADLPPMVEFKKKADEIILKRYGISVEHVCAVERESKLTFERQFYKMRRRKNGTRCIYGFPMQRGAWCNNILKVNILNKAIKALSADERGAKQNIVQYLGIASDEPERIKRHTNPNIILPLVDIGWSEAYCRSWCEENDLLSPIYTTAARGGCWFCHNQGVGQLRTLRKNYPEYWKLMLKWDKDSPVTFTPNGKTVHDFDRRFRLEDEGVIDAEDKLFRWADMEWAEAQMRLF